MLLAGLSGAMASCPTCEAEIDHVLAEMIDLKGTEAIDEKFTEGGRAVATVCPQCDAIIGI